MNLHMSSTDFEELINLASTEFHIPPSAIRKDYFITYILMNLSQSSEVDYVVFKGGTSLSKCYPGSIERFSEDIDLTYIPELGASDKQINKRLKKIEKMLIGDGKHEIVKDERNHRNKSSYVWFDDTYKDSERIKLEIGSSVKPHPYSLKSMRSYIHEYLLLIDEVDAVDEYELESINVNVLDIERTFVDKLMSVKRHALCGTLSTKVRHLYDVVRLCDHHAVKVFLENSNGLKEIIQITKKTDEKYLEKRNIPKEYNPLEAYDYESWKDKLNGDIKAIYESLHKFLLFTDIQQDWREVDKSFSYINEILMHIEE